MNDAHDNARADRDALERYGDTLTHAVTIHQPLAWAVAAGHCPVVPSDTRPGLEHEGKLIGIHAARVNPDWTRDAKTVSAVVSIPRDLTYGALIGVAKLAGVRIGRTSWGSGLVREFGRGAVTEPLSATLAEQVKPWWRSGSKWGLLLSDAVLLPEPIPMRGAGGVWRLPTSLPWPDGHGPDEGTTARAVAGWALEQWRKARASR